MMKIFCLSESFSIGQADQRTVQGQQAMALPATHGKTALTSIDPIQNRTLIEFNEGGVTELQARLAPGSGRHDRGVGRERFKEIMPVRLNRADGFLQEQRHDVHKAQVAAARETFVVGAVLLAEGRIVDQLTNGVDREL